MGALAIVLAGGSGSRMEMDRNKVYVPLVGQPVITWSLSTLQAAAAIDHLVLVHRVADADEIVNALELGEHDKLRAVVPGGASRTGSELAGLAVAETLLGDGEIELDDVIMIHDGARPFLTLDLIDRLIDGAAQHGGAIPGCASQRAMAQLSPDRSLTPLDLDRLRRVQTPQAFRAGALISAFEAARAVGFDGVDTAQVVERFGPPDVRIKVVDADRRNIKITVASDLVEAEAIAKSWTQAAWAEK